MISFVHSFVHFPPSRIVIANEQLSHQMKEKRKERLYMEIEKYYYFLNPRRPIIVELKTKRPWGTRKIKY
jgi:hypothetical protein